MGGRLYHWCWPEAHASAVSAMIISKKCAADPGGLYDHLRMAVEPARILVIDRALRGMADESCTRLC